MPTGRLTLKEYALPQKKKKKSVALPNGTGFAGGLNSAILRYAGAPDADPTTSQTPSVIPLVESDLHALVDPAAVSLGLVNMTGVPKEAEVLTSQPGQPFPGGAEVNLNLDFTFVCSIYIGEDCSRPLIVHWITHQEKYTCFECGREPLEQ